MLQDLIDETVEEILANHREDGSNQPIQAARAAQQVLGRYNLTATLFLERIFGEAVRVQEECEIVSDWYKFARTSLADFIAEAAKRQMGAEYDRLLHSRIEALAPSAEAYAE